MSSQIEYIEPTQEHIGQTVEVSDCEKIWRRYVLLGVVNAQQKFVVDNSGAVIGWKFARIPRPLTYAERQAKCGLKVGDRVRFVRAWEGNENCTTVSFVQSMQDSIGKVGYIKSMSQSSCCVELKNDGVWFLPYFVLEKVEDRKAIHDDYGKIVYVDGSPQDEFKLVTTFCEVVAEPHSCTWFAVVRSGDKRFVYELSNLRVKE